ncbi:rhodanese-like domain-containing protein [Spirosoma montaniterrae]|uniref:Sulfurtransferase n=1 Tax=Spirosoma montaniterrae TaxID=1178516 RepID=A0A1P9X430_9BACT|nr:rhodanese-like domain-containing protein [Spirosoma montaniterrae]AQG82400.1 sulfurtransferase [Spirosoma montaniterrae]
MTRTAYTDISLNELETLRQQPGTAVVDVRDVWEYDEFNLGGINLPLSDIRARRHELLPYQTLIMVCTNGTRSRIAAKDLRRQPEFDSKTIYHLQGGLIEDVT